MSETSSRVIQLVRPAHIYYTHKDVQKQRQFLLDFGFIELSRGGKRTYFGGYGTEPWLYCLEEGDESKYGGMAFVVESEEDLQYASLTLPGATGVYELKDAPGKGLCVTFHDPVDGFPFHLVYGQEASAGEPQPLPELSYNLPTVRRRPANSVVELQKRPAPVYKLGHVGMCITNFDKQYDFYTTRFNFKTSNIIYDDNGKNITAFNRLDRGETLVDHHCFFFFEGPKSHVHHASFETHDFDTQTLGHDWLREKGYRNCWGVGRHTMGSQIFDYWFDAGHFILEHYADGDLFESSQPTIFAKAAPNNLHQWGPELPATFMD